MGWFSRNFPTLSRLFSGGTRNKELARTTASDGPSVTSPTEGPDTESVAKPMEQTPSAAVSEDNRPGSSPGAAQSVAELPDITETTPEDWVLLHGGPVPHPPSLGSALGTQLDEFYDTWVGLGERLIRAQEQLQTVIANRGKAASLREEARLVFVQAESAWDEAQRLGDAAWRAFNQSFAEGLRDPASRWRFVKEIYEARMVQARIRSASNKDAWAEADRVRETATGGLLEALSAIAAAAAQVEREMREAASLPSASEALRVAALEDLRYARALSGDRAHLGQEPVDQLDAARITEQAPAQPDKGASMSKQPESVPRQAGGGTSGGGEPAPPAAMPDVPDALEREEPAIPSVPSREPVTRASGAGTRSPVPATSQENGPTSAAEELRKEMDAAAVRMSQQQNIDPEAEEPTTGVELPGPGVEAPAAGANTAAQEMDRELASLSDLFAAPDPPQGSIIPPSEAGGRAPRVVDGETGTRPPGDPPAPVARPAGPGGSEGNPPDLSIGGSGVAPSQTLPAVYTGRLYLMFPSSVSQNGLESVWEALEEVAGLGAIVDTQLISREAGIQFTVNLGSRQLVVEELRKRMPGAGMAVLGADRLKVDWLPRR